MTKCVTITGKRTGDKNVYDFFTTLAGVVGLVLLIYLVSTIVFHVYFAKKLAYHKIICDTIDQIEKERKE